MTRWLYNNNNNNNNNNIDVVVNAVSENGGKCRAVNEVDIYFDQLKVFDRTIFPII